MDVQADDDRTAQPPQAARAAQAGDPAADVLDAMHPAVRAWFAETLGQPTEPQALAWPAIARGDNTLILAPTGSGKTLAAFLLAIDSLYRRAEAGEDIARPAGAQVLYVSPLRALNNDVHRNLEVPLAGIDAVARRLGLPSLPRLRSAVRTGDTLPEERRRMLREPPHILITTPESLFLMLCSRARRLLSSVRTDIVDEIHALFPNKRGAQLSLALEYLEQVTARPVQRIGLSATQRPLEAIAAYLGGGSVAPADRAAEAGNIAAEAGNIAPGHAWRPRPVTIVETPGRKRLDFRLVMPVADFADLPEHTVWPEIYRRVYELATKHRSTLVFVNNRQAGERLAACLNDLAGEVFCRVHHGSVSREARLMTEQLLKAGALRCLVATSTLELGIDIGQIDLVVQVESPHEIARGLQRVGRSGHVPGSASKGRLIPKTRADMLEAAVIAREMLAGRIEPAKEQANAIDVLSQFVTGAAIAGPVQADSLYELARRSYNYRSLPPSEFVRILGMISGHHDTGEFLGLRALVYWDRISGEISTSERGRRLTYTSGGTIPDTGNYAVVLDGQGVRIGELDEEFVSERRIGDTFTLGTSGWRITQIMHDRVAVVPAAGGPRVPFWKGEMYGRGFTLGKAVAEFLGQADRALACGSDTAEAGAFWRRWGAEAGLDRVGIEQLREYLASQRAATGRLPSESAMVVEEFRDELGQWRVVVHSPYGARINAPMALMLGAALDGSSAPTPDVVVTDDTILFGFAASEQPPYLDLLALSEVDLRSRLAELLRPTALFGRLFREAAGRALLLPRHAHGRRRTPLWLTRRKSASLLQIVERAPGFPLVHEAIREALSSLWDVDGLAALISALRNGEISVHRVRREGPSPFARPVVFAAVGAFMYTDDLPHAERRLRYLGMDHASLQALLGEAPLRQLLDPFAMAEAVAAAQPAHLRARPPASPDELHLWLLRFGELPAEGAEPALVDQPLVAGNLAALSEAGRAVRVKWAARGSPGAVWVATEDLADYRVLGGLAVLAGDGTWAEAEGSRGAAAAAGGDTCAGHASSAKDSAPPSPAPGTPAWREPAQRLALRYARRHSPFQAESLRDYYGWSDADVASVLRALSASGRLRQGEFRPGAAGAEWTDAALLEEMHRRSLARARRQVRPADPAAFCRFVHHWQGVSSPSVAAGPGPARAGIDGLARTLDQLQGIALPAEAWEATVLPSRVSGYVPSMLDTLVGSGQYRWRASGGADSLRVSFWPADRADPHVAGQTASAATAVAAGDRDAQSAVGSHDSQVGAIRAALAGGAARFVQEIWRLTGLGAGEVIAGLERMMIAGEATNDTFGPVRQYIALGARYRGLPRTLTPAALAAMGRWSLAAPRRDAAAAAGDPARLLDRYGVLSREAAAAEGVSWAELLPALTRREMLGSVRRGYFVRGLGGAQFALPQAVEALRQCQTATGPGPGMEGTAGSTGGARSTGLPPGGEGPPARYAAHVALLSEDPAQVWGSLLPWPEDLPRPRPPFWLVTGDGRPTLVAEGRPWRLSPLTDLGYEELEAVLGALVRAAAPASGGRLEIGHYDGRAARSTPAADPLVRLGFVPGPMTMTLFRSRATG
jgi:ATP-dependent Lhr-like helicase